MSSRPAIYLDYNATTPCDSRVLAKMLPYFSEWYGNPANGFHLQGRHAARAVERARAQVASLIGAQAHEIVFTGGATESNNLAILGLARARRDQTRNRIVTSVIEHKAVLMPCKKLGEQGFDVTFLPVDQNGRISIETARAAITERTLLVSIQAANNEIGTLEPIQQIAEIAHECGALFHSDAAQTVGKVPIDVENAASDVDMLSISAHKLYGPKGIGALFIRGGPKSVMLEPLTFGGGQENEVRPGTSNVPSIVGFGEACEICHEILGDESVRLARLRDDFEATLLMDVSELRINAKEVVRLPNTSSLTFPGIDADALLLNLPEVMMSTGSACASGAQEPSHVLQAIGLSRQAASSTIRVSLGRFTYERDIERACALIPKRWRRLSEGSL